METTKTTKATFGWVAIDSANMNALSNNYQNIADFRRALQGKPITKDSILKTAKECKIHKYNHYLQIHSFFPEDGVAYFGNDGYAEVRLKWEVHRDPNAALTAQVAELTAQVANLTQQLAALTAALVTQK